MFCICLWQLWWHLECKHYINLKFRFPFVQWQEWHGGYSKCTDWKEGKKKEDAKKNTLCKQNYLIGLSLLDKQLLESMLIQYFHGLDFVFHWISSIVFLVSLQSYFLNGIRVSVSIIWISRGKSPYCSMKVFLSSK